MSNSSSLSKNGLRALRALPRNKLQALARTEEIKPLNTSSETLTSRLLARLNSNVEEAQSPSPVKSKAKHAPSASLPKMALPPVVSPVVATPAPSIPKAIQLEAAPSADTLENPLESADVVPFPPPDTDVPPAVEASYELPIPGSTPSTTPTLPPEPPAVVVDRKVEQSLLGALPATLPQDPPTLNLRLKAKRGLRVPSIRSIPRIEDHLTQIIKPEPNPSPTVPLPTPIVSPPEQQRRRRNVPPGAFRRTMHIPRITTDDGTSPPLPSSHRIEQCATRLQKLYTRREREDLPAVFARLDRTLAHTTRLADDVEQELRGVVFQRFYCERAIATRVKTTGAAGRNTCDGAGAAT
ncbi:hypothetical protein C8J57DRAFT_1495693 [Mycena rebaudengoi]|nr:hypothetical protein C8J57DRAFT_1495693 [Mycena rebaudengoi]